MADESAATCCAIQRCVELARLEDASGRNDDVMMVSPAGMPLQSKINGSNGAY
jgi:hypothetical protein